MQVDIPEGTATLRDKVGWEGRQLLDSYVVGARSAIRKIFARQAAGDVVNEKTTVDELALTADESYALRLYQRASVVAFLRTWSLNEVVPRSMDEFADVDPEVGDALAKVTFPMALAAVMRPAINPDSGMDAEGKPILDSPTGPSTGSEAGVRADTSNSSHPSTESSPSDTTSTATVASSVA